MKFGKAIFLLSLVSGTTYRASAAETSSLRGRDLANGKSNGKGKGKGKGNGNSGGNDDGDRHVDSPSEEEDDPLPPPATIEGPEGDIQTTADLLGLDIDDAALLLKQQQDFSEVVATAESDSFFLQSEMPSVPNGEFVVKYKNGNIPKNREAAINAFKKKNNEVTVNTVASKISLKDAEARGDRLKDKLEKKEYSHVSYSIDGDNLEVIAKKPKNVKKKGKEKVKPKQAAEILDMSEFDDDLADVTLVLEDYDGEDPVVDFHTYGGRKISGGGYQCTTGFSVINSSGSTGVSTAAHCTGMNWYDAVPPELDYSTAFQSQHNGGWGDVEWHTTAHIEPAEYYYNTCCRWPVRSIATSISQGQVVCGYSRMYNNQQGRRFCDTVYRTSVTQGSTGRLVAMKNDNMIGGDSGGPWSYYDKAFGVVKGAMVMCDSSFLWWEWDCYWRDTWSRASFFGPAIGVQVRTQ